MFNMEEARKSTSEVLVEITRGPILESRHHGSVAVVNSTGRLLNYAGNPYQIICMRSAAKPIQALNVILTGAADCYSFSDEELAIICASHYGEEFHRQVIMRMLDKMGLTLDNIHCGEGPMSIKQEYLLELVAQGYQWNQSHSDCSGKHCGFLAACLKQGFPIDTYDTIGSPLQSQVLTVVAKMCEIRPEKILIAEDGCGVPVHGLPLYNMALAYAKMANPENLEPEYQAACRSITTAMNNAPEMLAGTNGFCTELLKHSHGKLIGKLGAEAVYGIGVIGRDLGIAIKIDDGNYERPLNPAVMEVLKQLNVLTSQEMIALSQFVSPVSYTNYQRRTVGEIKAVLQLKKP